jgi:hypothetical protein
MYSRKKYAKFNNMIKYVENHRVVENTCKLTLSKSC